MFNYTNVLALYLSTQTEFAIDILRVHNFELLTHVSIFCALAIMLILNYLDLKIQT
jgi:hypothetical protein